MTAFISGTMVDGKPSEIKELLELCNPSQKSGSVEYKEKDNIKTWENDKWIITYNIKAEQPWRISHKEHAYFDAEYDRYNLIPLINILKEVDI